MRKGQYQLIIGIIVLTSIVVSVGIIYYFSFKPKIETNQTTTISITPTTSSSTSSSMTNTVSTTQSNSVSTTTSSILSSTSTSTQTTITGQTTSTTSSTSSSTTTAIAYCSDGTSYGACSLIQPKYCSNGNLIDKCSTCGCPTNYVCQNDDTCKLSSSSLIGATVHTFYVPTSSIHWQWYQNSSTYWEYNLRQPSLGFYDQTQGTSIQDSHYSQLKQSKLDYALLSYFGGINDPTTDSYINTVMDKYWSEFTRLNDQGGIPINLSLLFEFGGTDYQTRLNFVKTNFYDKYPKYVLRYENKPLIALSLGGYDAPTANSVISYAKSLGFYVISDVNVSIGGAGFTGITMKSDDTNRIGSFAAGVSPSVDVTGKTLNWEVENLNVNSGCGQIVSDTSASNNKAVKSTSTSCYIFNGPFTSDVPTVAQYLTEWYTIFRVKTSNANNLQATLYVKNDCGKTYAIKIINSSIVSSNKYVHIPLQFSYDGQCKIETPIFISNGDLTIDRIWITNIQFRKPSTAEYDSQWQPIYDLTSRSKFITIASFNAWEEGSSIEKDSYFDDLFLTRTSYWVDKIRNTI